MKSFSDAGGSAAAGGGSDASLHHIRPSKLSCSIMFSPGETVSSASALELSLFKTAPNATGCKVTISEESAVAVLSFANSADADKAKNPLKTCEIVVIMANKKKCNRKVIVKVVQPKKSEMVVQPALP